MFDRILLKSITIVFLTLFLLLPTWFVRELISERSGRQQATMKEANHQWASAQTITGPYLVIPRKDNKQPVMFLLPQQLSVNSNVKALERSRSVFKMVFYNSELTIEGKFKPQLPAYLSAADLDFVNTKLCIGITDFKGIEDELSIVVNGHSHPFTPGLPSRKLDSTGFYVPLELVAESFVNDISFSMTAKIKGNGQLHFVPLAANSHFMMKSSWPSPSFDGSALPSERNISDKGFDATWKFNRANLPFPVAFTTEEVNKNNLEFGVSVIQPADQYAETDRCIKYALLVIGLTFGVFFLIELLQHKPFHTLQYFLAGIALIVFYTLLLSFSEYISFDLAYLIAAVATITLITLYVKGHFRSWKTAGVFTATLSALYGFIFVILRLEDSALLTGSIGLFTVLAVTMYYSRKINWNNPEPKSTIATHENPLTPNP